MKFKDLTTSKIGGSIRYFFNVNNLDGLVEKVLFAKRRKLPIFIIGEGSDILVSDRYFNSVVIRYTANKIEIDNSIVTAEAGVTWDKLVKFTVDGMLQGMECLSGIPGTVGASPIQNIGAYGQELLDTFVSLKAYDIENEKVVTFDKKKCEFGYRESIFKRQSHWQKYVILEVKFKLNKIEGVDLLKTRKNILKLRNQKLEDPRVVPNAGSFFKNPIIDREKAEELKDKYSNLPVYETEDKDRVKVSLAWIIDHICEYKNVRKGNVGIYKNQALVIVNEGDATAEEIIDFVNDIKKIVKEKTDIEIEMEVEQIY